MLTRATRQQFMTLHDAVTLAGGDEPAIIYVQTGLPDIIVTRTQFYASIQTHANAMHHLGLQPGNLVIIAHTQNLDSIYAFWGALLLGAIPSMFPTLTEKLDPQIYMQHLSQLVDLSNVKAMLTSDDFADQLAATVNCPVYGTSQLETDNTAAFTPHSPDADAIAFLQHSSGTTGLQKGVALTHEAVLNQLASYSDALQLTATDVIVSWLPLYHDMGLIAGFLLPLVQGITLVLMSPFDWVSNPALLFKAIDRYSGTFCWLPNFAYNHCARRIRSADIDGLSLANMRAFINCSEPVRHDSHQQFLERFGELGIKANQLAVSYAMAENVFAVTQTPIGQTATIDWIDRHTLLNQNRAEPIARDHSLALPQVACGPPLDNVDVCVVDGDTHPLPEREVGEIAIKSDCLLTGYYHRGDLQPLTTDGWYRTGDRGYMAGGEVYVVGRSKDLIINAGKNIYPQDIEAIVNTVPGIHPGRAVVFGIPDDREGTELIAVVAEVHNDGADQRQIKRTIRQRVSQQSMVTVSYVELVGPRWLIKTSSGKIARAANREKWLAQHG